MVNTSHIYYLLAASFTVYFLISYIYKLLNINNVEKALKIDNGLL